MRLATAFSLLLFCAPLAAQPCDPAQTNEVCPDTTDWKRYFPLDVGNVWHYYEDFTEEPPNQWSWSITGEADVDGETYVVLERCDDLTGGSAACDTPVLLRYNDEYDMVVRSTTGGDVWWREIPCNLSVDFNMEFHLCTGPGAEGQGFYGTAGAYEASVAVSPDIVSGDTRKGFAYSVGSGVLMYAGLGATDFPIELQGNPPRLVYAHVDGQQYGTPAFASCEPDDLDSDEVCPDTTDWRRYFPLEVGNQWQHHVDRFIEPPYDHGTEIVGETEIEGEAYFFARRCAQGAFEEEPTCGEPFPIRYDEEDRVVVRRVEDGEGNVSFEPYHTSDYSFFGARPAQPLDAVFGLGDPADCEFCFVNISGSYDIGFEGLGDTEKTYSGDLQGYVTLIAGVGVVGAENIDNDITENLVYARVGGEEVGSPLFEFPVAGEGEGAIGRVSELAAVFPNPVQETVTVRYALASSQTVTLEVVDLLGRRVRTVERGRQTVGVHEVAVETAGLPVGLYLLWLHGSDGLTAVRRVAVVR